MKYSPIALFVYNRPKHTQLTVEALQKNNLANESELYIFSDAAKSNDQDKAVSEVRDYIHSISGFKAIKIIQQKENKGLAQSIIDGVTELCNRYGRVIVLEDDLLTSPYFLKYMNDALNHYEHVDKVMHVAAYMFPIDAKGLPDTFLLRLGSCWGWATWSSAWQYFEKSPEKLIRDYSDQDIRRFNLDGSYDFWSQVEQNNDGVLNTWAVFWYASIFNRKGLSLHPSISMVKNIGTDGTGINSGTSDIFITSYSSREIEHFESDLYEHADALGRIKDFLNASASMNSRLRNLFKRMMKSLLNKND